MDRGSVILSQTVEEVLQQNWQRLSSYALRLSGSRDEAGDLLQSCAMKALASAGPPSGAGRARAWLFTILRHVWIDEFRHRRAAGELPGTEPVGAAPWRHDDRLIAEITVRQALGQIDPAHRQIIELVDLAGFRYAEAAAELRVPVGTVMSRLSRARLALLDQIQGENLLPLNTRRGHGS